MRLKHNEPNSKNKSMKVLLEERVRSRFCFPSDNKELVTFLNPYSYLILRKHTNIVEQFDAIYIDGSLLCFFLSLLMRKKINRNSFDMSSIAPTVFERSELNNMSIYLIGSEQDEIEAALKKIKLKYPRLIFSGYHHGYFTPLERANIIKDIINKMPDIVIVGMGALKQELLIRDLSENGWRGYAFTCGGFIHQTASSDTIYYYPRVINKLNLRWLYRLWHEPWLLQRYLVQYPKSIFLLIYDWLKTGI